jgi:hypothetical protein
MKAREQLLVLSVSKPVSCRHSLLLCSLAASSVRIRHQGWIPASSEWIPAYDYQKHPLSPDAVDMGQGKQA